MWSQTCGEMAYIVICKVTLNKSFFNLDFHGGKLWVLRTLWRNLHMFLEILEFRVDNKKSVQGNYFENLVS